MSTREPKLLLDGLSKSTLRKLQRLSQKRAATTEQVIKDALELYESIPDDGGDIGEQLAKLEKSPIVKAYLRFRAKKTAEDLGEAGRKSRAKDGGKGLWTKRDDETLKEFETRKTQRIKLMNDARLKGKKK